MNSKYVSYLISALVFLFTNIVYVRTGSIHLLIVHLIANDQVNTFAELEIYLDDNSLTGENILQSEVKRI